MSLEIYVTTDEQLEPWKVIRRKWPDVTEREAQVLAHIGARKSNKEIGRALGISEHTVKVHVSHIMMRVPLRERKRRELAHHLFRSIPVLSIRQLSP